MLLTAYLLALGSAALYGAADFLGGLASRRASTIVVLVIAQAAGLLPLALLLPLLPGTWSRDDLLWSAAAGLAGSGGVGLLYRALAVGTMSIVAPTTALCAVVLPVAVDVAGGQGLTLATWIGIGLALVAIVLVSQHDEARVTNNRALPPGLALALLSGIAIGLFFITLARTSPDAGVWPLVVARSVSVALFSAVALLSARPMRIPGAVVQVVVACGVIDALANALYLLATRGGALSVVVTLASLYPASTVLLARLVIGERVSRRQAIGVACALAAVVLIVGGA